MKNKDFFYLLLRYVIIIFFAMFSLPIIYKIFTPLTTLIVDFILNYLYPGSKTIWEVSSFIINDEYIELIPACIAGAAYYFLLMLNLSTSMSFKKRIKSILFLFGSFFVINVARIVLFIVLFMNNFKYFDFSHQLTWHLGSTLVLAGLWFLNIWVFKITSIPAYSDIKNVYKEINKGQKRHDR